VNSSDVDPSILRLKRVTRALGDMAPEVVFIGGAIAALLQLDPPFQTTRATKDVDGLVASTRYGDARRIAIALHERGFSQTPSESGHIHRWKSPDNDLLDLVPAGGHLGGSGQDWDPFAILSAVEAELGDGIRVRHANAPAFLALKWAAFHDRGEGDWQGSHDIEDIIAVVASRSLIVEEVEHAPEEVRRFVAGNTRTLLAERWLEDILASHLNNTQDPQEISRLVRMRLESIGR